MKAGRWEIITRAQKNGTDMELETFIIPLAKRSRLEMSS